LRLGVRHMAVLGVAVGVLAVPDAGEARVALSLNHVGEFSVPANLPSGDPIDTVTSAEITDATPDGRTLVYTDSPTGRLGFVDIRRPDRPKAAGTLDMAGEPTSVATLGKLALVAVNTRKDPDGDGPLNEFDAPSGDLVVVDVDRRRVLRRIELAGQPDSIAISPDERWAAIVIENERDEEENDGLIPQAPPGALQVLDLKALFAKPLGAALRTVALTGLADYVPEDPEPEYVDINRRNQAVVTLQENNHLVVVDLKEAKVISDFPAGSVTLQNVDATEEELGPQDAGLINLADTILRRREPDAVQWVDDDTFATANEGDYEDAGGDEGGSRGFTLFRSDGVVEYESGASFEHAVARIGHFPQGRAENKGVEPEGLEVGTYFGRKLLFLGAERANVVGVYDVGGPTPKLVQMLPAGIGPEGLHEISSRGLLAVASEVDGKAEGFDARSLITLYKLQSGPPVYPYLASADATPGLPITWGAISGLAGDPKDKNTLWAVSDSAYAQAFLYEIDTSKHPARIVRRIPVGGVGVADQATGDFDLEGVAARPEGGFWLASEGRTNAGSSRPNLLVRTDAAGAVLQSVPLPPALVTGATSSGFEGVAVTGTQAGGDETVWAVIQREWSDDPSGSVKIARYEVAKNRWTFARYELDDVESPSGGWVGLSEISLLGDGHSVAIVERDDRIGLDARIKRVYGVDLADPDVTWREFGQQLDTVAKTSLRDVLEDLDEHSISVPDKLEGLGVTRDGRVWLATDNDAVDENYGETLLVSLGKVARDWER
jgi:Esterase-like activity of phytase